MDTRAKYEKLLDLYLEAYPSLKRSDGYTKAQKVWNSVKHDEEKYNKEILRLKSKKSLLKSRNLSTYFNAASKKKKSTPQSAQQNANTNELEINEKSNEAEDPVIETTSEGWFPWF